MLKVIVACFLIQVQANSFSQNIIDKTEALLIKEAKTISDKFGDKIWPSLKKTPFTMVLITDSIEYLVYHPYPSSDFILVGKDEILQTEIYTRKRTYSKDLLATFPAVNGLNCIVVGTPKNTNRTLTNWMITLLHEHFHQFVNNQPNYYDEVNKLNLSGGDETGMWMLNYPFPYDSAIVVTQYEKYIKALLNAVNAIDKKEFPRLLKQFKKEKENFRRLLKKDDYKYFSFQLWQEGLASYTEYSFLESLKTYVASTEVASMKEFTPLKKYKEQFYKNELQRLQTLKLPNGKRVCIYAVGFAEGLLLDKVNKQWRSMYLKDKFSTDTYY
jgi:hypothetical protein